MAPKRTKRPSAVVDLTAEDVDDHGPSDAQPQPKRRRVGRKHSNAPPAIVIDDDDGPPQAGPSGSAAGAGPSAAALPSPPATGKGKKKSKSKEDEPEKRQDELGRVVKYRPNASRDIHTRIERAMPGSAHRMFLVDTKQLAPPGAEGGPAQEFHVLGATGNVYAVRISRSPHCTCPDFAKGNLCKHILFVMLRVLRQSRDDPVIWQRGLLTHEVEKVLSGLAGAAAGAGVVDQSVLASDRVRQRYAAIVGATGGAEAVGGNGVQRPVEGDCPICYEELKPPAAAAGAAGGSRGGGGRGGEAIVFCHTCGNNMHKECFERWAASKRSIGVTCVYCRAPWHGAGGGSPAAGDGGDSEYVNLSQYSDAHRAAPSLEELYGTNAYFIMANSGEMSRRQAARLHAAARGWV